VPKYKRNLQNTIRSSQLDLSKTGKMNCRDELAVGMVDHGALVQQRRPVGRPSTMRTVSRLIAKV
jgi:hypothetical protein